MLHNSISVDMKIYALQLKQKSIAGVFNGILQNFRTATFDNNFVGVGGLLLTIFRKAEPFNLENVIHFYIPKKGLSSPVLTSKFQWLKYLVVIRQIIKVLRDNLSRVNECATMPAVNEK